MAICDYQKQIESVSESTLEAFDKNAATAPDVCSVFYNLARDLDAQLLTIYRFAVEGARDLEAMEAESSLWNIMVKVCDRFSQRLENLIQEHPTCGATHYRDRILDLRNKCQRLTSLHS